MRYYRPQKLEEAIKILEQKGPKVKILAGGTDLVVQLKEGLVSPEALLDLTFITSLRYIKGDGNFIQIGPLTTHSEIENSPLLLRSAPLLVEGAKTIGSPQIRNRGTIGGNIANASPAGDTLPALYVLEARLKLRRFERRREVKIEDFFLGPGETILQPDELIEEIFFPPMSAEDFGVYLKLGQRNALAISIVSVAIKSAFKSRAISKIQIALGAVAPQVLRARRTEERLMNSQLSKRDIEEASQLAAEEASPISDIRGSADYRRELVQSLVQEGLNRLKKELTI